MDSLPARVDVAVIGGGLAGLATAWALGERGHGDVVVLERDAQLASHASARNAAMCRALAEDDAWTAWTAAGAAFLRHPPAGFGPTPLVDERGAVLLAGDAVAAELAARARRFELRASAMTAAEVARRWPGLAVARGGLFFPDDGNIDLAALVDGFARGARAAGARLLTGAEVEAVVAEADGGVTLTTARGRLRAAQVVVAAGAWSDEVAARGAGAALGLVSRRRHIIALHAAGLAATPAAPIVWNVDGDEWYARPAGPEIWASACDSDPVGPGDVDLRTAAIAEARARLPSALAALAVARAWACQRTFAAGAPVVARDRDRPWLVRVVGLGGHGVTASAAIGRAAAAIVDDRR